MAGVAGDEGLNMGGVGDFYKDEVIRIGQNNVQWRGNYGLAIHHNLLKEHPKRPRIDAKFLT